MMMMMCLMRKLRIISMKKAKVNKMITNKKKRRLMIKLMRQMNTKMKILEMKNQYRRMRMIMVISLKMKMIISLFKKRK